LKAGVTHACYYDPEINKTLAAMAEHYHIAVIPTRVVNFHAKLTQFFHQK